MRPLTSLRVLGCVVVATAVVGVGPEAFAQTRAVYPQLDVRIPVPPRPLIGGGLSHLDDGRTLRGDPLKNESDRAFGANVLAVADGTIVSIVDGIPENVPDPVKRAVPITPETLGGNYILLDLGDDVFAFYGHLQPGSLKVGKGDRVRRGQVLALVGNTGNSTEPHLHFHLADRASAFDAEGIPYVYSSFDVEAAPEFITPAIVPFGNSLAIDESGLARWREAKPQQRQRELPMRNTIVSFGNR